MTIAPNRRMPTKIDIGQHRATTMASPITNRRHWVQDGQHNPHGLRVVMGYFLPTWQRGLVWSEAQQIALIESAWKGVDIGTFTINQTELDDPLDNLLIDGQQRMHAIERYLDDAFPVLGWRWSEVTAVDRRYWDMSTMFASFVTHSDDEVYLRSYYDLMNFGGVAHKPEERAHG